MDTNKISKYLHSELILKYVHTIDSTNTYLMDNEDDIDLLIASNQSMGKGRYQNSFDSYNGGIYFSLRYKLDDINIELINIKMVLSVFDALKQRDVDVDIKWLNDIYYNNKKVCGILCENSYLGNDYQYSVIGVGINLYQPNEDLDVFIDKATYLFNEDIDIEILIVDIINNFLNYLNDKSYLDNYRMNLKMIDKKIKVDSDEYIVVDILSDGRLFVKDMSNKTKYLDYSAKWVKILDEW